MFQIAAILHKLRPVPSPGVGGGEGECEEEAPDLELQQPHGDEDRGGGGEQEQLLPHLGPLRLPGLETGKEAEHREPGQEARRSGRLSDQQLQLEQLESELGPGQAGGEQAAGAAEPVHDGQHEEVSLLPP